MIVRFRPPIGQNAARTRTSTLFTHVGHITSLIYIRYEAHIDVIQKRRSYVHPQLCPEHASSRLYTMDAPMKKTILSMLLRTASGMGRFSTVSTRFAALSMASALDWRSALGSHESTPGFFVMIAWALSRPKVSTR
eukprot:CAMPEP_0119365454 /NCGR_PEP_ID=MMETSP1334-20130426/12403_1 /TAXON_ID=127549 /ORGANISM="Calcidiscus leptoporus, Strain RCC1130" /LENGTH=135 /DNA_ID=CAMNT_0007381447 /DNA_START=176 /DNA_END=583 /DNA_ORIENTATION=+